MPYEGYQFLNVEVSGRIVTGTVSAGEMNMITPSLLGEFSRFLNEVADDSDPTVLVLKSATAGFFIGHAQFGNVQDESEAPVVVPRSADGLNVVHAVCELLRTMPKVTIAQIEGRATGGGAAIAMACDLRYAAIGKAVFNSFGVGIGTGMGGGGSQYMPRLIGRSRAMEIILAGLDLDAETADAWGYVTRSLSADALAGHVERVASRIAACVPRVIRETKALIASASTLSVREGLAAEAAMMQTLSAAPAARRSMARYLGFGGETVEGESHVEELLGKVLDVPD